jgi:hypothetical protein
MRLDNANFDVNKTFDDKGYTQYFLISAGLLIKSDSERALLSVVTFLYSISLSFLTTDSMVTYYVIVSIQRGPILMFLSILGSRREVPWIAGMTVLEICPFPLCSPPGPSGSCEPTRASGCSRWCSATEVPVTRMEGNAGNSTGGGSVQLDGHTSMYSVGSWASFPWPQCRYNH